MTKIKFVRKGITFRLPYNACLPAETNFAPLQHVEKTLTAFERRSDEGKIFQ